MTILRALGVRSFFREPREVSPHRASTPQQLLQLAVFILERLQLAGVGYLHAGVLRTPRVERRVADPVFAAQLNDRDARLVLLQHVDDLLLAEVYRRRSACAMSQAASATNRNTAARNNVASALT